MSHNPSGQVVTETASAWNGTGTIMFSPANCNRDVISNSKSDVKGPLTHIKGPIVWIKGKCSTKVRQS